MNNTIPHSKIEDLESEANLRFQDRSWRVEQIGFGIMLLIVLLALLGILGGRGPLSAATADGDGLRIDYQRFTHVLEPTTLNITVQPAPGSQTVQLAFSATYLDQVDIQSVRPEPDKSYGSDNSAVFIFSVPASVTTTEIEFELQPNIFGVIGGQISLEGGPSLDLRQVVYP
jgi:hypothetical protein